MPNPSQVLGIFLLRASSGALLQHVRMCQQLRALKEQLTLGSQINAEADRHWNNFSIAHREKHPIGFNNSDNLSGSTEGAA
ncbi:MAG: hypothetical protein JWO91_3846 [Acidobacteriaceae bacterium]|nr:hypothetical protein [Acidobacteriaceae bacterium]